MCILLPIIPSKSLAFFRAEPDCSGGSEKEYEPDPI